MTGRTIEALDAETLELPPPFELLVPLVPPETWAAGVTYERSRDARVDESRVEARDVYSLVYDAERPELFMKDAAGRRTVGPGATVGVRSDAPWTVPEPELGARSGCGRRVARSNDRQRRDRARRGRCEPPLPPPGQALRRRLRARPGDRAPGGLVAAVRDRAAPHRARRRRRLRGTDLDGEDAPLVRRARGMGGARESRPRRQRSADRHRSGPARRRRTRARASRSRSRSRESASW